MDTARIAFHRSTGSACYVRARTAVGPLLYRGLENGKCKKKSLAGQISSETKLRFFLGTRRHGSRLAVPPRSNDNYRAHDTQALLCPSGSQDALSSCRSDSPNAAPNRAATREYRENDCSLLTVNDVATLLQVPVSWVYARTRKRSIERLPGIRLGKYWRFREEEIHAWVESQRRGHRAA